MNDKITFPRLASMLADRSGRSKRFSEDFLREFFALISEQLEAGESVKIKGLGTFRLTRVEPRKSVDVTTGEPMEISGHSKVVFVPAKELAEAVNSPFEAFSAIEISDDADLSQLFSDEEVQLPMQSAVETPETTEEPQPTENISEEPEGPAEESEDTTKETEEAALDETETPNKAESADNNDTPNEEDVTNRETEDVADETSDDVEDNVEPEDNVESEDSVDDEEEFEAAHRRSISKILWVSFGAALVALAATLTVWYVFATDGFNQFFNLTAENARQETAAVASAPNSVENATAPVQASIDTVATPTPAEESLPEEVPTAPSDAVVYDTISTTRFLTTMAKIHYGNYNLWPYIYEENKSFLGHPDRIRPGTPVVIPKLSKFGVDPNNSADIEKAKKMGVEIYARYNKKI